MTTRTKDATDTAKAQAAAQLSSIKELAAALTKNQAGDDDASIKAREDAEQTIHEDALSVEVRSGWYTLDAGSDKAPAEYNILLCTGGPACRIIGALAEHGEPESARIEYQDWGTPWTVYPISGEDDDAVLTYARCFYFGE